MNGEQQFAGHPIIFNEGPGLRDGCRLTRLVGDVDLYHGVGTSSGNENPRVVDFKLLPVIQRKAAIFRVIRVAKIITEKLTLLSIFIHLASFQLNRVWQNTKARTGNPGNSRHKKAGPTRWARLWSIDDYLDF